MSKLEVKIDGRGYEVEVQLPPAGELREMKEMTRSGIFSREIGGTSLSFPISSSSPISLQVTVDGEEVPVTVSSLTAPGEIDWMIVGVRPYQLVFDPDVRWLRTDGREHRVEVRDLGATISRPASGDGRVKAPIPGLITRLLVASGDRVEIGQPLLTLEAMKMENEIRAPRAGTVKDLHVSPGASVGLHALMVEIE